MSDELAKLPEGWSLAKFGELTLLSQNGCSERHGDDGTPTVVLRLADLSLDGKVVSPEQRYINLSQIKKEKYRLTRGDLLAFRVNGSRDIAGQVAYYQGSEDFTFCDHFIRFRLYPEFVDPKFIATAFKVPSLRSQVEQGMVSSAGQNTVAQSTYANIDIPFPPLNEQKRIVAKIEELRDRHQRAKQALEAIPELCDRFRQSVLAAAFQGDLTADWREENPDVEPASVLLERIRRDRRQKWEAAELEKMNIRGALPKNEKWKNRYKEAEAIDSTDLFNLPEGWRWVNADDVCWQITDGEHNQPRYATEGFPMLTAKHVRDGFVDMSDINLISEEDFKKARLRCAPENGDLLIVSVGATTGRAAVVSNCNPFAIVRSVLLLKPLINAYFILNWTRTRWCQLWIGKASGATAQAHLYINDTKQMPIPLPPLAEQEEILNRINAMFELIDSTENISLSKANNLDYLNQSILAKAFRGELVEQDPNDEPASVLLERIRAEREKLQGNKKSGSARGKRKKATDNQLDLPGMN